MNKKWKIILPALFLCVSGTVFCCTQRSPTEPVVLSADVPRKEETETANRTETFGKTEEEGIWVYVCGSVRDPGVYCLDSGARVFEALDMAGGACEDARMEYLNLAEPLRDGQQIYVPGREDPEGKSDVSFPSAADARININTATVQELETLPGIGAAKADAIIAYRERTPFQTIEDIMRVPGIKEQLFSRIRDLIRV